MFKLVRIILTLAHLLAQREEQQQKLRQAKFKRSRALLHKQLREEESIARAKADVLASRAATASADAIIGSNYINEAERVAASLRCSLDFVVKK